MEGSQPPFPTSGQPGEEPGNGDGSDPTGQPAPEQPRQSPEQQRQYPPYGYQQPAWQQQQSWQQQQAYQQQAQQQQQQQQAPQYGQPAPDQPAPVQTPYGYYQPPGYPYAHGYYYYGQPPGPGNDVAVASLTTAGCSIGALVLTAGIVAPLSLIASIIAVVLGVKGKNAVDAGKTRMHRDVARAGFWVGILGIVLSVLAAAAWVALVLLGVNATKVSTDPGDLASLLDSLPF